ncbi:MAG: hypothetical protein H6985_11000 [Pseudomonadales bacterium]|nr:hypothetical protein [Halioglobus sp.]MCP5130097.1 hypothetical protein [Pseudomonadales bacterium]
MRKTLFLHVGMGKTGTTALQNFFWLNRRELRRRGISYPKFGMVARAHHLLSPYIPPDLRDKWSFKTVAEWSRRLQKLSTDTILLSSELMAWAGGSDVAKFCDEASKLFDLKVVIYLRRQDDIIMANYNQLVKAGLQQFDLEWVVEKQLAEFDYKNILEPWAQAVGSDSIIVRPYERRQFFEGDICRDFMYHVFGMELGAEFRFPKGDSNPRFSNAAMAYKLQLNRLIAEPARSSRFNRVLLKYSAESGSAAGSVSAGQSLLSPAERADILERSQAANQLVAREYMGRSSGQLFDEWVPEDAANWVKPELSDSESRAITQFIRDNDRRAYRLLVSEVNRGHNSLRPLRMEAVEYFREHIPPESLAGVRKRELKAEKARSPRKQAPVEDRLLVISVHFPAVPDGDFQKVLQSYFGHELVMDYQDRPLSLSGTGRNLDALRKGIRFARMRGTLRRDTCLHGHFMPLKYSLPSRGHRKRFVAWMSDPVERLVAHYAFWKSSINRGMKGGLHYRMLEEDWSLETFCLCPELRNIYSKFLWCFPLSRFDFIGISEHRDSELQRFSSGILGICAQEAVARSEAPVATVAIDAELRARVQRYHSADMALYRRALGMRERALGARPKAS